MLATKFGVFVRLDLKLSRHELTEHIRLFVVDMIYFVLAGYAGHIKKVYLLSRSLLLLYHFQTLLTMEMRLESRDR